MSEPWVDILARHLAGTHRRRGILRVMIGLLVGGTPSDRGRMAGAAMQLECHSGWETYCTELAGADECIDFRTDSMNCGNCGRVCPELTQCADFACVGTVEDQPPPDVLSASVQCNYGPRETNGDELIDVTVSNNAKFPVTVVHIGSQTGPAQPGFPSFEVASGESWQGLLPRTVPDGIAQPGAIVTTDAGVLILPCGDTDIPFTEQPVDPDQLQEKAGIISRALSILERSSAPSFDALYALLHPDARDLVSYSQLACWYWNYVQAERPVGEGMTTDIQIVPWTWAGNGKRYEEAAEVSYFQAFSIGDYDGGPPPTEDREFTIHLVQYDGLWRWFFGTDPAWLAGLPEVC